jgi:hypothetical protein
MITSLFFIFRGYLMFEFIVAACNPLRFSGGMEEIRLLAARLFVNIRENL